MKVAKIFAALVIAAVATGGSVSAQGPTPHMDVGHAASEKPGLLGKIGIDQRIGQKVPLDLPFVDENGRDVKLGDYFGKRPVLLAMVYYECTILFTQVINGVTGALNVLNFNVGH